MGKYCKITKEQFQHAASIGLSRGTVWRRYKYLGWDLEDALNTPTVEWRKRGDDWYYKAVANGIDDTTYRRRLYNGWPIEDAATKPVREYIHKEDNHAEE